MASCTSPWGAYPSPDSWPLVAVSPMQGENVAAACQIRPLTQNLTVKAGRKVTLKLHSKAATLPRFVQPERLGKNTPAHRAIRRFKRGVNLGNCWETYPLGVEIRIRLLGPGNQSPSLPQQLDGIVQETAHRARFQRHHSPAPCPP